MMISGRFCSSRWAAGEGSRLSLMSNLDIRTLTLPLRCSNAHITKRGYLSNVGGRAPFQSLENWGWRAMKVQREVQRNGDRLWIRQHYQWVTR